MFSALDQSRKNIKFLPPAIIKPHRLWSGKQVLSTIIINSFPDNRAGINLTAGTKISDKAWQSSPPRKWKAGGTILIGNAMTEAEVVFRGGELMSGVLDKTHFGATPYSLIHCVYDVSLLFYQLLFQLTTVSFSYTDRTVLPIYYQRFQSYSLTF